MKWQPQSLKAVLRHMLHHGKLRGLDDLRETANLLYETVDPQQVLAQVAAAELHEHEDAYELEPKVPFFNKQDLGLHQGGDVLIVALKNQRRHIALPETVRNCAVTGARYEDGQLII